MKPCSNFCQNLSSSWIQISMIFFSLSTWIRDRTFKHFTTPSLHTLLTLFIFQLTLHNSWHWNNVLYWRKNQHISLFEITMPNVWKYGIKKNAMPWIYKRESVYGTRVLVPSTQFTDYLFVSSKRVLLSSSYRRNFLGNCIQ